MSRLTETDRSSFVVNFYTLAVPVDKLPFFLMGSDIIPEEVLKTIGYASAKESTVDSWILNGGKWAAPFQTPDALMATIGQRLEMISNSARTQGSIYYRSRMVVDLQNLVDESVTDSRLTVVESLIHIDAYLVKVFKAAIKYQDEAIQASIVETLKKLRGVLVEYKKLDQEVSKKTDVMSAFVFSTDYRDDLDVTFTDETHKIVTQIVDKVFSEFNMITQRDTFLTTRLTTYVHYDYSKRIRSSDNMTPYQQDLLIVTGNELLGRLKETNRANPAQVEMDLQGAQVINTRNIEALAQVFGDNYKEAIMKLGTVVRPNEENVASPGQRVQYRGRGPVINYDLPIRPATPGTYTKDDENSSFDQLKAKFCLQTLMFNNWNEYQEICRGAVVRSRFQQAASTMGLSLNVEYDKMAAQMATNSKLSQRACILRDYLRENQVYWLTVNFGG